jgi:hypothetical protein
MQPLQYLILAREIRKNESGIFSFIDVCLHLAVNELPARGKFDMAIICGPGWEAGKYRIHIATKIPDQDAQKIGFADVEILDESHIYTAVVNNLGLQINNANGFSFQVYKELSPTSDPQETQNELTGDLILERPFNIKLLQKQAVE